METIERLAQAAVERDHLQLRSLVQDLTRAKTDFSRTPRPQTRNALLLSMSAALTELLASRQNQHPPSWTREIGPAAEPFFLLESVAHMKRLRELCETQSPEPLRKRNLYAPPHFLEFA